MRCAFCFTILILVASDKQFKEITNVRNFGKRILFPLFFSGIMLNFFKTMSTSQLLYKTKDIYGVIEVKENSSTRSLYFGSDAKQSSMYLCDPDLLALNYTKVMAMGLFLQKEIDSVLILGLGGGSLAKFIHRHFPNCRIDVVEYNETVRDLAYEYFELPQHSNIQVHLADAGEFVRNPEIGSYDLILVDVYHGEGMSDSVKGMGFYNACCSHIKPKGLLIMNFWTADEEVLNAGRQALSCCFSNTILEFPVENKANLILFAPKQLFGSLERKRATFLAKDLTQQTGVEFVQLLRKLRHYNPYLI